MAFQSIFAVVLAVVHPSNRLLLFPMVLLLLAQPIGFVPGETDDAEEEYLLLFSPATIRDSQFIYPLEHLRFRSVCTLLLVVFSFVRHLFAPNHRAPMPPPGKPVGDFVLIPPGVFFGLLSIHYCYLYCPPQWNWVTMQACAYSIMTIIEFYKCYSGMSM